MGCGLFDEPCPRSQQDFESQAAAFGKRYQTRWTVRLGWKLLAWNRLVGNLLAWNLLAWNLLVGSRPVWSLLIWSRLLLMNCLRS